MLTEAPAMQHALAIVINELFANLMSGYYHSADVIMACDHCKCGIHIIVVTAAGVPFMAIAFLIQTLRVIHLRRDEHAVTIVKPYNAASRNHEQYFRRE